MVMYVMSDLQYQAVYNCLSFALASMMATTMYLWFRSFAVVDKYKSAVLISGLVTFIAAYHYIRIFNSWVEAYHYSAGTIEGGALETQAPTLTGIPFNDAYRYMDWLLTVPLLLIEILLVMNIDEATFNDKAWTLGVGSALMIASGYYGELVVTGDLTPRWMCWALSMVFFLYIVYELLVGLTDATNSETDPVIKGKIGTAQVMTVISWCTYPVVYLFPMMGINAAHAIVGIQIGYCASDIISKCGVGLLIYQISYAKSSIAREGMVKTYSEDLEGANDAFAKAKALKDKVQAEFKQAKKEVVDSSRSRSLSPAK
jgi:bacteriorhodopsin